MKIAIASDLHLEFGDIVLNNDQDADVLILAGDICIAEALKRHPRVDNPAVLHKKHTVAIDAAIYRAFFKDVCSKFKHVLYVAGNHEFYRGGWNSTLTTLRSEMSAYSNMHFMEDDHVCIDGINFVGATLWTDLNKNDPITAQLIKSSMNDYSEIRDDARSFAKLHPTTSAIRHQKSREYIQRTISGLNNVIVITHHAPAHLSIPPHYKSNTIVSGAYYSDLTDIILDNPQIKKWCHGHTHHRVKYMIGETEVICNTRGYVGEQMALDFKLEYFVVDTN